jgi:hypothetical protein
MKNKINTVKELFENKELMQHIVEDLEDFEDTAAVTYEVWALGYDEYDEMTDTEFLLKTFTDPDEAVTYAKSITLADIVNLTSDGSAPDESIVTIQVEVETVVADEEGTTNVGTVYYNTVYKKDEYADVVDLSENDYKLLEDGSIEVSCELLGNFNKNDQVQIMFIDEDPKPILTYRIISKTTADTFICEFNY